MNLRGLGASCALSYAAAELMDDPEIIMEAIIKHNRSALIYASHRLKSDLNFIIEAIELDLFAFEFASAELRDNSDILLMALEKYALSHASNGVEGSFELHGHPLEHASSRLSNDRDIVLGAVNTDGLALEYASKDIRDDFGVVRAAVQNNGRALNFASNDLRGVRELVLTALDTDYGRIAHCDGTHYPTGGVLGFASIELTSDRLFMLEVIRWFGPRITTLNANRGGRRYAGGQSVLNLLRRASPGLKADAELVLEALVYDSNALDFASESLRDDRDFMLKVAELDVKALRWASKVLKRDRLFIIDAVKINGDALEFDQCSSFESLGVVRLAIASNPNAVRFASARIRLLLTRAPASEEEELAEAFSRVGLDC